MENENKNEFEESTEMINQDGATNENNVPYDDVAESVAIEVADFDDAPKTTDVDGVSLDLNQITNSVVDEIYVETVEAVEAVEEVEEVTEQALVSNVNSNSISSLVKPITAGVMMNDNQQIVANPLFVEGYDEVVAVQNDTFNEDVRTILTAQQNSRFISAEVVAVKAFRFQDKMIDCAVVLVGVIKGMIPYQFFGVNSKREMEYFLGHKVSFYIHSYEYNEKSRNFTFVGDRKNYVNYISNAFFTHKDVEEGAITKAKILRVEGDQLVVLVGGILTTIKSREASHLFLTDLRKEYKVNQLITVKIIDLDKEKKLLQVSAKQVKEEPYTFAKRELERNQNVIGRVTGVEPYGIFVRLNIGVDLMCPFLANEEVFLGDKVLVRISNFDDTKKQVRGRIVNLL